MLLTVRNDISNQIGNDVLFCKRIDSSGNPAFKAETVLSSGYTDITNVTNWNLYGRQAETNYENYRNILIDDYIGSWGALSSGDKGVLVENFVYPSGTTDGELDGFYTSSERSIFNEKVIQSLDIENALTLKSADNPGKFFEILVSDNQIMRGLEVLPYTTSNSGVQIETVAQWNASELQGRPIDNSAPTTNQFLKWDGSKWIPSAGSNGLNVLTSGESEGASTTTSDSYQQKLRVVAIPNASGQHIVHWSAELDNDASGGVCDCRVQLDDVSDLTIVQHQTYSAGYGDYHSVSGFKRLVLATSGNIDVDFKRQSAAGGTAKIRRARVVIMEE